MGQPPAAGPPFGRFLRSAISAAEFRSPTAFARAAGVEPSVVLRWISGKAKPTTRTLAAVAPVLNLSAADLIRAAYPDEVTDERPEPPKPVREAKSPERFRRRPRVVEETLIEGSGGAADPDVVVEEVPAPVDVSAEFRTALGILRWLTVPKIDLADLLHGSGLDPEQLYPLVVEHRRRQVEFDRQELQRLREEIRKVGGSVS